MSVQYNPIVGKSIDVRGKNLIGAMKAHIIEALCKRFVYMTAILNKMATFTFLTISSIRIIIILGFVPWHRTKLTSKTS